MAIEKIDLDLCIRCGICVKACSLDVIAMNPQSKVPEIVYQEDCMLCDMCMVHCPASAITITPEHRKNVLMSWG